MLEANANLGPKGGGIFHKFLAHFGDDAELPRYAWKRWGNTEAPAEGTLRQRPRNERTVGDEPIALDANVGSTFDVALLGLDAGDL